MAKRIAGYIFLPWLLLGAGQLAAQPQGDELLELDLTQLLQVTISGSTLRDESLKTVPSVVTVFTREQLDRFGLTYLHELLRLVPGFQVSRLADQPINYTYSASGRRTGSRAREIALIVDGRPYADPRSAGADSSFPLFPLANIERIEIIQGPGSAIYGSGAFTGVINVLSRRQGKRLDVAVGGDQRRRANLGWNQQQGDWQANLFAYAGEDGGQAYQTPAGTTRDPRQELGVDMGMQYRNTRLQLAWYQQGSQDFYALEKVRNGDTGVEFRHRHLQLQQLWQPAANWQTWFDYQYQDVTQLLDGMLAEPGALASVSQPASSDAMLARVFFDAKAHRLALANDLSLAKGNSLQFGAELAHAEENEARAYTNYDLAQLVNRQFPLAYYGDFSRYTPIESAHSWLNGGAYLQWLHALGSDTRLTLGLRHDEYEDVAGHLSPRLGLVHQLNAEQTLKLLYGEAFRAPAFAETRLMNNPFLVGNPDLTHELVSTWNLVWLGSWQYTSFYLSSFYSRYEDAISTGVQEGVRTYTNAGDADSHGASLDIRQQWGDHWLARLSYTRFTKLPGEAFREAEELAVVALNYQRGPWNWNLSANYQGDLEFLAGSQRQALPGYWSGNSQVIYALDARTRLKLLVKNLWDEEYLSAPNGASLSRAIPNRGREWSLGLEWSW